jgi:hypothetical protein
LGGTTGEVGADEGRGEVRELVGRVRELAEDAVEVFIASTDG